jgi:integrase
VSLPTEKDTILSTQRIVGMHKRSSSDLWQQRIMIPVWARPLYDGKAFIRVSLGTPDASQARRKSLDLQAQWTDKFEQQRALVAPPTVAALTPDMQAYLSAAVRHRILATDDRIRFDPATVRQLLADFEHVAPPSRFLSTNDGPPAYLFEQHPDGLAPSQVERLKQIEAALSRGMRDSLAMGRTSIGRAFAEHEARLLGLSFDWDKHRPALVAITRAVVSAYLEAARRTFGDPVETPDAPEVPESAAAVRMASLPVPKSSKSLRTLYDVTAEWKVARKARPDAIEKTMRAIGLVEKAGLSPVLSTLDRAAGLKWRLWLQDDSRPFGVTTGGKHFQTIMALFNFAAHELPGWLTANPWTGIEAPRGRAARRIPWDTAKLNKLFDSPLYASYTLPDEVRASGTAAYWVPILAIYSGARLAELCNLRTADVAERDGVLLLDINELAGSVKSAAGVRAVPVHSELLRLGFADFVNYRKATGSPRLFNLYEQPSRDGPTYLSDWFRKYRTAQGCGTRWQDMHAMRTTVSTKLRGVHPALNESLILALLGHEGTNTGQTNYTVHDAQALQRALESLEYPGLALPRVYRPEI